MLACKDAVTPGKCVDSAGPDQPWAVGAVEDAAPRVPCVGDLCARISCRGALGASAPPRFPGAERHDDVHRRGVTATHEHCTPHAPVGASRARGDEAARRRR